MSHTRKLYIPLAIAILLVICLSCVSPEVEPATPTDDLSLPADTVELAYFHRIRRCEACLFAEERIKYVVNTFFQDELSSGKLQFGIYELEDKNNKDLLRKYGAIGSQLFVNRIINGVEHIRYIEEIWYWGCIDNQEVFDSTVRDIIHSSIYGTAAPQ